MASSETSPSRVNTTAQQQDASKDTLVDDVVDVVDSTMTGTPQASAHDSDHGSADELEDANHTTTP